MFSISLTQYIKARLQQVAQRTIFVHVLLKVSLLLLTGASETHRPAARLHANLIVTVHFPPVNVLRGLAKVGAHGDAKTSTISAADRDAVFELRDVAILGVRGINTGPASQLPSNLYLAFTEPPVAKMCSFPRKFTSAAIPALSSTAMEPTSATCFSYASPPAAAQ